MSGGGRRAGGPCESAAIGPACQRRAATKRDSPAPRAPPGDRRRRRRQAATQPPHRADHQRAPNARSWRVASRGRGGAGPPRRSECGGRGHAACTCGPVPHLRFVKRCVDTRGQSNADDGAKKTACKGACGRGQGGGRKKKRALCVSVVVNKKCANDSPFAPKGTFWPRYDAVGARPAAVGACWPG